MAYRADQAGVEMSICGGIRLATISTHLIQTFSPLYRELASRCDSFEVLYLGSVTKDDGALFDPGFGLTRSWDVDLTGGYRWSSLEMAVAEAERPGPAGLSAIERGVTRWLRQRKPDAVLLPGWTPNYLATAAAIHRANIPIVVRGTARVPTARRVLRGLLSDSVKSEFLKRTAAVAYIGAASRDEYLRLGVPRERMVFSPYTIDDVSWGKRLAAARSSRAPLREALGIPESSPTAIYVGKFMPYKQVDRLISAFALMANETDCYLLMAGDGPLRESLVEQARALGIDHRVRWLGFRNQTQLPLDYVAADFAALFSSSQETWGLVVNEAIQAGLPVACSHDAGSARDLVFDGVTGYRVDTSDLPDAAYKLSLLADPATRREMAPPIARTAKQFTVRAAVDGVERAAALATR